MHTHTYTHSRAHCASISIFTDVVQLITHVWYKLANGKGMVVEVTVVVYVALVVDVFLLVKYLVVGFLHIVASLDLVALERRCANYLIYRGSTWRLRPWPRIE